jgi:hypothetical protein
VSSWVRYGGPALVLTLLVVGAGWPWLDAPGRKGLLLAAGTALPLQLILFGILVAQRGKGTRFLAAWAGGSLFRMGAVGVVAGVVWVREDVSPLSALLTLVGLLVGLLALELWAIQGGEDGSMNGSERR